MIKFVNVYLRWLELRTLIKKQYIGESNKLTVIVNKWSMIRCQTIEIKEENQLYLPYKLCN
jgi:hypothetical protein